MNSACLVAAQTPFVNPAAFLSAEPQPGVQQQTPLNSHAALWRPWLITSRDGCRRNKLACPYTRPAVPSNTPADGKTQSFQHPVRLFWPKSKSYDYLYSDGEALLRNFPVQATISFYDESDSENEEEEDEEDWEDEEEDDCDEKECLKPQNHFTTYN
ncbi:protein ripply1 [Astyanax mexicanus]|uniref:protein ripply1 n=1 Tax=Astyanax mexicanus TaxID=7994 RepID=UPI0020CB48B5|nr:protein ripply1 [Astyanax mexicanus]